MKLYEYFGKSGFHTCLVTTFGIDFDAYENVIFSRARGAGCHNNLLIVDDRMLSLALDGNSSLPRPAAECGNRQTGARGGPTIAPNRQGNDCSDTPAGAAPPERIGSAQSRPVQLSV